MSAAWSWRSVTQRRAVCNTQEAALTPLSIAEDRALAVGRGEFVRTGYVEVYKVRLACRERMAIGDVDRAYQKRLQLGDRQPWPCPNGCWDGETFVIHDGRHEYVAALMLGHTHLLVAWTESAA